MKKRKGILLSIITGTCIMSLTGCGTEETAVGISGAPLSCMGERLDIISDTWTEISARISEAEQERAEEQEALAESDIAKPLVSPRLPVSGRELSDFVPEGWELYDSVELDFNEDKVTDYVGVLEVAYLGNGKLDYQEYPRILFAVVSDGDGGYQLSFQDINLIRRMFEGGAGGVFPMTAENKSFTTHSHGGKAWRWSEDYTYTYKAGTWYLTQSEHSYGYHEYITSYKLNDWEKGVGIRKERSDTFGDMEKHWDEEKPEYDLIYEISLDEMPTLEQAGMRWRFVPERITDWEVEDIIFAEGITLSEAMVKTPDNYLSEIQYNDEDCVLYVFSDGDSGRYYLAMYRLQDKVLSVLAESGSESEIDNVELYQGKIYYTTEIVDNITCKTTSDGVESLVTYEEFTVGRILHRMNTDGTGEEVVFEYRYPYTEQEIRDFLPPYVCLSCEISDGKIVVEVDLNNEPHPFYRMNTDGSGLRQIGQTPREILD